MRAEKTVSGVWPALVLILLAIPLIPYGLDSDSLVNADEGFYHVVAEEMVESGNWFRLELKVGRKMGGGRRGQRQR